MLLRYTFLLSLINFAPRPEARVDVPCRPRNRRYNRYLKVRLMPMNDSSSDQPQTAATTKKPYEKPSFRFEKVFVTSALSCGKVSFTQQSCIGTNNKAS